MIEPIKFASYSNNYKPNALKQSAKQGLVQDTVSFTGSDDNRKQIRRKPSPAVQAYGVRRALMGFALGAALAGTISAATARPVNKPLKYTLEVDKAPIEMVQSLEDEFGVNEQMVLYYNKLDNVAEIADLDEISIPAPYSYLDDNIEDLRMDLAKTKDSAKKAEIRAQLQELTAKRDEQNETALVTSDGKMVYYQITKEGGINVETFKNLFDIKDKYIRRNNDIKSTWTYDGQYDPETNDGYFDYTRHWFKVGDIVKVPLRALKD